MVREGRPTDSKGPLPGSAPMRGSQITPIFKRDDLTASAA